MATTNALKEALRAEAEGLSTSPRKPLSNSQYDTGFKTLTRTNYEKFIIPQLILLLKPLFNTRTSVSILEIGPGQESVLGDLPVNMRRKIKTYTAYEPNELFASRLQAWLSPTTTKGASALPCMEDKPDIRGVPFTLDGTSTTETGIETETYDVVLFCHSMYGLEPKRNFVERALSLLSKEPGDGLVVVFHRAGGIDFDGLLCHRTASFPEGKICVPDSNEVVDDFARFNAGFVLEDVDEQQALEIAWRKVCRNLAERSHSLPDQLVFRAPDMMVAFANSALALPELASQVPMALEGVRVKNFDARKHSPAAVMRPGGVADVQRCIRWANKHGVALTVIGGGHSGHCVQANVVAVDMGAFKEVEILASHDSKPVVVVGAGCTSGEIIRRTVAAGFTVPLGSRPSVGAGLCLQGGIGHLARQHGLTCDAIIGAVVVSVASGDVLCVGDVPSQCRPAGSEQAETAHNSELLWALRGAGTNFSIVISITFKAHTAPRYTIRNWTIPMNDKTEARSRIREFDKSIASMLPRNRSADAYLYYEASTLYLGVSMCDASTTDTTIELPLSVRPLLGPEDSIKTVDSTGLFDTELYLSGIHGGHAGGKTSSFKRCMFLEDIGAAATLEKLLAAIESRPSPDCYLHLLQGGGAVGDVAETGTAFGCRDWDFACVITGVWTRDQDGSDMAHAATQWVYDVAKDLSLVSTGCYGADLGPDPRDAALALKAFGPNLPRLTRLKRQYDPSNVLAYACPLAQISKLIVLITGDSCAGKDHCASVWQSVFAEQSTRIVSISDSTKQEYAKASGADLARLLIDRKYKEYHRAALTRYFDDQIRVRPRMPEEHFLNAVYAAPDVDVLFITGMRDSAPVATFWHCVPDSRVLEVQVKANPELRQARGGQISDSESSQDTDSCPDFVFENVLTGREAAEDFAKHNLLPFCGDDFRQLGDMVRSVPNFPSRGIEFRDVVGICQQAGGLELCTSMLQTHFTGEWDNMDVITSFGTGGLVFASALALRTKKTLTLIREAGKRPSPTISVMKHSSYISSSASTPDAQRSIELDHDSVHAGSAVVVVDDVLSSGETLCAVLELLCKARVRTEDIRVMVVAEFPAHGGRHMLLQRGFGRVRLQSLLVFGGM